MEYRRLGRTNLQVSAVSLGTEYLIDISQEQVTSMVHAALDQGINYFDLFFAQPRFRDQMGTAFAGRRKQALLAAHLGAAEHDGQYEKTRDVARAKHYFEDFLTRYKTDYADILLLHNSDGEDDYREIFRPGGLCDVAQEYRQAGHARFIGFSGHTVETSLRAVQSGQVDVLMFTINLAGHAIPGRKELFAACVQHDVGLIAMKPFAGGKLLRPEPKVALERPHLGDQGREVEKTAAITPVQCLAYVLAQTGVCAAVPGCKNVDELSAALSVLRAGDAAKDFSAVVSGFKQYVRGECVYCNHCLPCPSSIDIGRVMRLAETAERGLTAALRAEYAGLPATAADCVECGACTERCPFGVDVAPKMRRAAQLFTDQGSADGR